MLVVLTAATFLLALTLGGTRYRVGLAGHRRFVCGVGRGVDRFSSGSKRRAAEPILPLHLFAIPTFRTAALGSFVMSMAFLGVVMFMPLYMQVVQGVSATQSGVVVVAADGAR